MARPSKFTKTLAQKICDLRASGISLRKICQKDGMPSRETVHRWLENHEEFRNHYDRACAIDADNQFDVILELADNCTPDRVNVARLQIDVRKWALAKRFPRKYGDKPEGLDQPENRPRVIRVEGYDPTRI